MSTAILISGQMRSFAQCVANQNFQLYRRIKDPVFFVSCADDEQASSAYMLEAYSKNVFIERVKQPELPEPDFSLAAHAPYTPTPNNKTVVQSILKQLWGYKRAWEFAASHGTKFDTYVRLRPDLFFHRLDLPVQINPFTSEPKPWYLVGPIRRIQAHEFYGPWKATCGGVNDRFSVMGETAAKAYFTALDALPALLEAGCPLHPESIQQAALEAAQCFIFNTLNAEFTCIRLPGQGAHVPLLEYPGEMARYLAAVAGR